MLRKEFAPNPADKNRTDIESVDVGKFNVCMHVQDGHLQIRVYPRDMDGQLWDRPCDTLDVEPQEVQTEAEGE